MITITRKLLREWRACYSDEEIAALVPDSGMTILAAFDSAIPDSDRVWLACHILARHDRDALIGLAKVWATDAARWASAAAAAAYDAARAKQAAQCRDALVHLDDQILRCDKFDDAEEHIR